jgi:hypothetical protein
MPDMVKLAQTAKEVQDRQQKIDDRKIEILSRIEQKLDRILDELKKK